MKLKSIILTTLVMLILSMILTTTVGAKDINILSYKDRGIRYYPKYVKRGLVKIGKASWYGKPFHKRLTANGERYNMYNMTAAHRTYAMNTVLKITNLDTKKSVRVRINDRGPFYSSRDIDLSYGAARKLGMVDKGVGRVKIEVVSSSKRK
ncbi:MAG TPA: septal ring lytic transglycosylase RlpA family protein, partial [Campylobacterales bacterium]|nr:septal ring lytic transglycosylase RlpA family protein [Campylobacterales bacterium]